MGVVSRAAWGNVMGHKCPAPFQHASALVHLAEALGVFVKHSERVLHEQPKFADDSRTHNVDGCLGWAFLYGVTCSSCCRLIAVYSIWTDSRIILTTRIVL